MRWKSFFAVAIPSLILATVAVAENQKSESQMTETPLKAVVHGNFDDPERLEHGLGNVENVLKDVPDALSMAKPEPQGCLSVLFGLLGIRLGGPSADKIELPYRLREDFLSPAEGSFFLVLRSSLGGSFAICPKVNLADIFFVPRRDGSESSKNKIDRKHVDFLLCERTTLRPVLGIELDDASHARSDRQTRDQFVEEVFQTAGLPLLRVPAAKGYSPTQLADLVQQSIAGHVSPVRSVTQNGDVPICRTCEEPMVRRAAKKGDQKGRQFWGCRNYPKCRETVPI